MVRAKPALLRSLQEEMKPRATGQGEYSLTMTKDSQEAASARRFSLFWVCRSKNVETKRGEGLDESHRTAIRQPTSFCDHFFRPHQDCPIEKMHGQPLRTCLRKGQVNPDSRVPQLHRWASQASQSEPILSPTTSPPRSILHETSNEKHGSR